MIKRKNTLPSHNNLTTIFGYSLFALTVLSFIISTAIPFMFSFQYRGARYFNITVMVLVFAITTILPALASYFIGDRVTHTKSKSLHHYNGILFGVTAYWVAILFSWIGFSSFLGVRESPYPTPLVVNNIIPVILTIILMAVVAIGYAKKQKNNTSVLQYRPFQLILAASVVVGFMYPYLSGFFAGSFWAVVGTLSIPLIATLVAYIVLAKYQPTRLARLSDAIVAMSMGWVAIWLASSFITYLQLYEIEGMLGYAVGLIVFVAYLFLRTRKK